MGSHPGPVREQPHRVLSEKPRSRLTLPRPAGRPVRGHPLRFRFAVLNMRNLWTRLPRSAQSGALIGLFVPLLLTPFLMYAGWAFKNLVEQSVRPATGNNVATLMSIVALVPYLLAVFGIPA